MKRIVILIYLLSIFSFSLIAEEHNIVDNIVKFDKREHDFGKIKKSSGPVTCYFKVTNISDKTIAILSIISSCNCTRVKWDRKPLKTQETALITVTYDNSQGYYSFDKRLTVYISSIKKPIILRVKGTVIK